MLVALCFTAALWLLGLVVFIYHIPTTPSPSTTITDTVIILTGGLNRISEGFKAFSKYGGDSIFISGVGLNTDIRNIGSKFLDNHEEKTKVIQSTFADSTILNTLESKLLIAAKNYKSVRLVTSNYHIPRSKLLFTLIVPEVMIVENPVFTTNFQLTNFINHTLTRQLLINEYHKTLLALAVGTIYRVNPNWITAVNSKEHKDDYLTIEVLLKAVKAKKNPDQLREFILQNSPLFQSSANLLLQNTEYSYEFEQELFQLCKNLILSNKEYCKVISFSYNNHDSK